MSNYPKLPYARYPVYPELRCGGCGTSGNSCGCGPQKKGVAYKNGIPYDCKCNLIAAPYSMPYDAYKCKQCQPPYHAVCDQSKANCKCHRRASLKNNNMYEAFNFK